MIHVYTFINQCKPFQCNSQCNLEYFYAVFLFTFFTEDEALVGKQFFAHKRIMVKRIRNNNDQKLSNLKNSCSL